MKRQIPLYILLFLFISCQEKIAPEKIEVSNLTGSQLANIHCSKCHAFVHPELLPKLSWEEKVLPFMGHRFGIYEDGVRPDSLFREGIGGAIVKKANIFPKYPNLAKEDWKKIVDYYLQNAPDSIMPPEREAEIKIGLKHFKYKESLSTRRPPMTVMVKILPNNNGFVYSDDKRNIKKLTFLNSDMKLNYDIQFKDTPIHYYEKSDTIYLTTIGKSVFPHDSPDGMLQKVYKKKAGQFYDKSKRILKDMQRPIFMAYGDLNNDHREDIVACEFGHLTGKLVWYANNGKDNYSKRILNNRPGAIKVILRDVNQDGFMDIFVLMSQGDEGVFLYINNGNESFTEKRLLTFSPLNGSQNMELVDFNGDGFQDIIYVSGDNADKTPYLKSYHGIYIYLNDGDYNFNQAYFYQLNGAYKAMAGDYDLDGDVDIAAISFFPDYKRYPEESFVYLENKGSLKFEDYTFPQGTKGRWIVMDAADMDADGDIDIALGSHVLFMPKGDTTNLGKEWLTTSPSMIVLENTSR